MTRVGFSEAREMRFAVDCEECRRLSAEYEAATMEWFRVQGQLRVAEYSRDEESSNRIMAELSLIASRRNALREQAETHEMEMHPRTHAARGIVE